MHAGEGGRPSVAAIVVAHDSADVLPACLDALAANGVPAIVVDNESRDDSVAVAQRSGARVIRSATNEGFGRANNIGIAESRADLVLVCNPDVVLETGAVSALLAAATRWPDAGLFAPRFVEGDGRIAFARRSYLAPYLHNRAGLPAEPSGDCCAPFLLGACLLVRRDLFWQVGGFDPAIFLFYEDDDLCRRIADAGHALVHVHGAVARHGRGRSSRPRPGRVTTVRWHYAWSRAYVARKYGLRDPAPGTLLVNAARTALACLTGRRALVQRYAGATAGAWAFLRGRTALARQGLGAHAFDAQGLGSPEPALPEPALPEPALPDAAARALAPFSPADRRERGRPDPTP